MKTTFRFPGSAEYSYAELETTPGGVPDNARELRDVDAVFLNLVGNVLAQGCSLVALGVLQPQVIEETGPQGYDGASAPQWAPQAPQEAQAYSAPPQQYNAPQNGYQAPQGAYQPQAVQNQPNTPPGVQAPACQYHQRPAEYKPAGTSKKTGRPYNAFWCCANGDNDCTRASNFPRA